MTYQKKKFFCFLKETRVNVYSSVHDSFICIYFVTSIQFADCIIFLKITYSCACWYEHAAFSALYLAYLSPDDGGDGALYRGGVVEIHTRRLNDDVKANRQKVIYTKFCGATAIMVFVRAPGD